MTEFTKCTRCGGDVPANFPPGVCPTCLLQQGLSPSTFLSGAGSASASGGSRPRNRWTPPAPAELASRFPQLDIVELLGQGGMGAVYKVRQRDLDRWAALKVLPDDVAQDPNFAERFQREARALALLSHQHIVIVYEFGQRDGVYFLLMEYVDGVNLRQAIRAGQILAKDALSIVSQICDALQFAHEEGVVHRDIKPENILIDKRGRVKIADFGLAKLLGRSIEVATLTGTHQVMGTPVYMAPEQMEGTRGVDHRADIFSLGVVFYELLTGELPLGRFAPPSQKYSLDVRLDEVVLRTLEKEPDRRYQQASEVKGDVESIRNQAAAPKPSKAEKPRRRIPLKASAVCTFLLLGVLLSAKLVAEMRSHVVSLQYKLENAQRLLVGEQQMTRSLIQSRNEAIQPASPPSSGDPNEANAIVQFTTGTAKLNPNFGLNVLTAEQRVVVNQILTRIHKTYLEIESQRYTDYETKDDGTQIVTVRNGLANVPFNPSENGNPDGPLTSFAGEIAKLENELWTQIDSQIPFAQQKFLRQYLPLYADDQRPLPLVDDPLAGMGIPPGMMGAGVAPMTMTSMGMPGSGMMTGGGSAWSAGSFNSNLRYEQLLGWKQNKLPIRIEVVRRGKWYRWSIALHTNIFRTPENTVSHHFGEPVDRGEDPELPSGLRRFWRSDVAADSKSLLPQGTTGQDTGLDDIAPIGARGSIRQGIELPADSDPPVREISRTSKRVAGPSVNDPFTENEVIDSQRDAPLDEIKTDNLELPPDDLLASPERKARLESEIGLLASLDTHLAKIDQLRNGEKTPWNEVEQQTNDLLNRFPTPADKGRIHCQAAHLFAQGGIRDHAADVTRHAKEALKYERDPVQRAWMFMYLGNAAELHDNNPGSFVESRTEATRWYLKGYRELLPFHLPSVAPELPAVEKVDELAFGSDQDVDPEKTAAEVRHASQLKVRQVAEVTRELVEKREAYIGRLKELFGRLHEVYDKNADAEVRLRAITTRVLPDAREIDTLVAIVFPRG